MDMVIESVSISIDHLIPSKKMTNNDNISCLYFPEFKNPIR